MLRCLRVLLEKRLREVDAAGAGGGEGVECVDRGSLADVELVAGRES
jgi:hypothetical protein